MSFADLLGAASNADLQAFAHADVPFERLVEVLNPARSQARHPLFQVVLSFQNLPERNFELPGLRVTTVDFDVETAKFDLALTLREADTVSDTGMLAEFSFAPDLFDEPTVAVIAERFVRLLEAITAEPQPPVGDLEILSRPSGGTARPDRRRRCRAGHPGGDHGGRGGGQSGRSGRRLRRPVDDLPELDARSTDWPVP